MIVKTNYDIEKIYDLNKDFENLMDFFDQLFVINDIKQYVFEHLASSLIGLCKEQDFNYYIGKGSNGKSMLVNAFRNTFEEYIDEFDANNLLYNPLSSADEAKKLSWVKDLKN